MAKIYNKTLYEISQIIGIVYNCDTCEIKIEQAREVKKRFKRMGL